MYLVEEEGDGDSLLICTINGQFILGLREGDRREIKGHLSDHFLLLLTYSPFILHLSTCPLLMTSQ